MAWRVAFVKLPKPQTSTQPISVCSHLTVMNPPTSSWWKEALCAAHQIDLTKAGDNKELGEGGSLCKTDGEGKPREMVGSGVWGLGLWQRGSGQGCHRGVLQMQKVNNKLGFY